MIELLPCPFCGNEAHTIEPARYGKSWGVRCECGAFLGFEYTEAEAIEAWNMRAAMEFDNWFYLPKPKEPIVEMTEPTYSWDGTKVKADVFYQVQKQAIVNWARELDENIMRRICEVWNASAERTCRIESSYLNDFTSNYECWYEFEMQCGYRFTWDEPEPPSYCPSCGARIIDKRELRGDA